MRRPLKHYAIALYHALHTEGVSEPSVIGRFVRVLARDGVLAKGEAIIEFFRKEWNRREREVDVHIVTARALTGAQEKRVEETVRALTGKEKVNTQSAIDPAAIGGIEVRYDDVVLDGTVRRQLTTMRNHMSNG